MIVDALRLLIAKAGDHLDIVFYSAVLMWLCRNEHRISQLEKKPDKMKVISCSKIREACQKDTGHRFEEIGRRFQSGSKDFSEIKLLIKEQDEKLKLLINEQARKQSEQYDRLVELLIDLSRSRP